MSSVQTACKCPQCGDSEANEEYRHMVYWDRFCPTCGWRSEFSFESGAWRNYRGYGTYCLGGKSSGFRTYGAFLVQRPTGVRRASLERMARSPRRPPIGLLAFTTMVRNKWQTVEIIGPKKRPDFKRAKRPDMAFSVGTPDDWDLPF